MKSLSIKYKKNVKNIRAIMSIFYKLKNILLRPTKQILRSSITDINYVTTKWDHHMANLKTADANFAWRGRKKDLERKCFFHTYTKKVFGISINSLAQIPLQSQTTDSRFSILSEIARSQKHTWRIWRGSAPTETETSRPGLPYVSRRSLS